MKKASKKSSSKAKTPVRNISVKGTLKMPYKNYELPIEVKLSLAPRHFYRLRAFLMEHPYECIEQLVRLMLSHKEKPRKRDDKQFALSLIKAKASRLYALLSLLCKKPLKECPEYFQKLIEHVKTTDYRQYLEKNGKVDPLALTAFCIEKDLEISGESLSSYGVTSLENLENFYITYVLPDLRKAKSELKDRSIESVGKYFGEPYWPDLIDALRWIPVGEKPSVEITLHQPDVINFPDNPKVL